MWHFLNLRCGVKLMTAAFYTLPNSLRILVSIKETFFQWDYNIHEFEASFGSYVMN